MYTVCQKCGKKLTDPETFCIVQTAPAVFDFPDAIPNGGQNG